MMIFSLQGIVQELTPTYAVINVNGVGYYVGISLMTSQTLTLNQETMLFIQQIIREDANLLFGFNTRSEKEMFNLLISVNGVGAVSALILLSTLSLSEIATAILSKNSAVIQKAKGLGAKTAERIIVDLKDKVQKFGSAEENNSVLINNKNKDEALSALEVLGISKRMSEKIADRIIKQDPEISVEELVKQILKNI
ncbi:MAG: ruvA [Chryseobacterium sp.]|jgi:Holliday junction DNA helicase RuvA|nr:ruvA [Chryseobacterium sp.]